MKRIKLTSLLIATMVLGGVGATPMIAHAETINTNSGYTQNINSNCMTGVINKQVAITQNGKIIGYANKYDMAIIENQNENNYSVITEFGLKGEINKSDLTIVKSGLNSNFKSLNENGYVTNVTTDLHFRTEPTVNSEIISNLKENQSFKIIGKNGEWYKINLNGKEGYVYDMFVGQGNVSVVNTTNKNGDNVVIKTITNNNGSKEVITTTTNKNGTVIINKENISKQGKIESQTQEISSNKVVSTTNINSNKIQPVENHSATVKPSESQPVEHHSATVKPSESQPVEHHSATVKPSESQPVEHHSATVKPSESQPVEHHSATVKPSESQPNESHKSVKQQNSFTYMPQISNELAQLMNNARAGAGKQELTATAQTNEMAMKLGYSMAENGNANHGNDEMGAMITSNLTNGNPAQALFNLFYNDAGHREEMLSSNYIHCSVAVYKNSDGTYFAGVQYENVLGFHGWKNA
ncbi:SH3 domain-containing protein [Clostridium thermobutyricum]|uniref:SH3 domain-containing protein n=1 Tax=Clostridium thermobutyricum TaxID=29372 RepID=UPI002942762F|nr:SH3 domain-containing protein [Clostridium thermobutyricum]